MSPAYNLIVPYLYIGKKDAMYKDIIFDTIINCTQHLPFAEYCKKSIRVPVENSTKHCKKFFDIIKTTDVLQQIHNSIQNKKTVLIHCMEGMHRSCSLAACYFMKYHNMNVNESMKFIKSKRIVAFNPVYKVFETIKMYYDYLHSKPKEVNKIEIKETEHKTK